MPDVVLTDVDGVECGFEFIFADVIAVDGNVVEEFELVNLVGQRGRSLCSEGVGAGQGEVDAVGIIGCEELEIWSEVFRAQALTCDVIRSMIISYISSLIYVQKN